MRDFAGFVDENAVIRTHAAVDHTNVRGDERDLRERRRVDERRGRFLFRGEDDTVCRCIKSKYDGSE